MLYLTLRQYEYVTAIARLGSLSAAALHLNVSQPALSVALSRIETHLGFTLFVRRRGAPLQLTPKGRAFATRAEQLLQSAAALEDPSHRDPPPEQITLGCFIDLAPFLLAPALAYLRDHFPTVSVQYRVDRFDPLAKGLMQGQIDMALTYDLGLDAGFERRVLERVSPNALLATDHPMASLDGVTLADICNFPLILSEEGVSIQHMLQLFRAQGLNPNVTHRAATLETLRSLAAHKAGIGISYSVPALSQSYDGTSLAVIPITDSEAIEPVVLTRHGTGPTDPLTEKLLAGLSELRLRTA